VINFPTKRHWRGRARIADIEKGLRALVSVVRERKLSSLAVPALGCGNGGLNWAEVKPLIVSAFDEVPEVEVILFPPAGAPDPRQMPVATERPDMTRGRAALIALIAGYAARARAERVEASDGASLLEIQKLMYLLQVLGQPMRLSFAKGRYGPYAENLNHQLQKLEGHFVRGYGDRSQPVLDFEPITLMPGAADTAATWLDQQRDDLSITVAKVLELVDGFASPYGLELLTTVHWVAQQELPSSRSSGALVSAVQDWSRRKAAIFTETHVRAALNRLTERGLLVAMA
jgi:O-acetyl-ADP-ribose deacetylase (regulator of RNase III)